MADEAESPAPPGGDGDGYLPVSLACATFLVLGVASAAFGVLLPEVRDGYGVSNTAVGLFFLASTAGYLISALASGTLVVRLGQRGLLLLGVGLFGGGYALFGVEPVFAGAVLARFVASLGVGGLEAGINIGLAARPNSSPVMNTAHAFWGVGALFGPVAVRADGSVVGAAGSLAAPGRSRRASVNQRRTRKTVTRGWIGPCRTSGAARHCNTGFIPGRRMHPTDVGPRVPIMSGFGSVAVGFVSRSVCLIPQYTNPGEGESVTFRGVGCLPG